ncbi:MAG TPA: integrase core domain-containing protein [Candidatus Acidoferrum sp.]
MSRFLPNAKRSLDSLLNLITDLAGDVLLFFRLLFRSRAALSAEVLFLRKQLALYEERQVQPRRLNDSARFSLLFWSRLCNWKEALVIVKPETLIGWHRKGFKLFWKWKSQAGRPRLPESIRKLIVQMAQENPTWGQARVAAELSVKLGIYVSPRTVRAYWPPEPERRGHRRTSSQNWRTFVRNHAQSIVACDFLVVVTARFRTLYVVLLMEVGTRRIVHCNVTAHPTAAWTLQQLREAIPSDHSYRFLIHDRDAIFSAEVDHQLKAFGLRVLHTPARAPRANAYCERLVGTIRRECLDFMIPVGEKHLRRILSEWVTHYNQGRPHLSLGPGIPERAAVFLPLQGHDRHSFAPDCKVVARAVLGGLHHEYRWERIAA